MPQLIHQMSEYEKLRAKNIEENKRMLESLGLLRSFKPILEPLKKKRRDNSAAYKKIPPAIKRKFNETKTKNNQALEEIIGDRIRRSLRVKGIEPERSEILPPEEDVDFKPSPPKTKVKHENVFGMIPGVVVGTHWDTRIVCSGDGVHRPTVAGIHGNSTEGCYSIALSGGYEDDIDLGESFTYTGSGGRDLRGTPLKPKNLRTAAQSMDQSLTKHNLALSLNVNNRKPVRVIRGYKCPSAFAPEYGYRYDGLYSVEKCWSAIGLSGYLVWKYVLKRLPGQAPPPWKEALSMIEEENKMEDVIVSSGSNEVEDLIHDDGKENRLEDVGSMSDDDGKENRLEDVGSLSDDNTSDGEEYVSLEAYNKVE